MKLKSARERTVAAEPLGDPPLFSVRHYLSFNTFCIRKLHSALTHTSDGSKTTQYHTLKTQRQKKKPKTVLPKGVRFRFRLVELKAAKTHTVLYQINRTEYYCQVDLPLSDYPLYGKQLVASRG